MKGRTVTANAMHAQRVSAAAIVAKGGDCVLENHLHSVRHGLPA